MLRDVGGGKVVVRLFDITVNDDTTWAFTPRLVTIEKSTVVRHHQDLFAASGRGNLGALWVPMIEKAYVAAGYLGREHGAHRSVEPLDGEHRGGQHGHRVRPRTRPEGRPGRRSSSRSVRRRATAERPSTPSRCSSGTDGSGLHSTRRRWWCSNSNAEITSKGTTAKGHSGGEQVAKGLVGGHAYSVLGTKTVDGRLYLVVRNPWGKYGREYDWKAAKGAVAKQKDDAGEFMLELNDTNQALHEGHDQQLLRRYAGFGTVWR